MKITWNKNPLLTTIELDDAEKELLRWKIKAEELTDLIEEAKYDLKQVDRPPKNRTAEECISAATNALKSYDLYAGITGEGSLDKRVDEVLGYYIEALGESHCGDCVCVACSCTKCHAEVLLRVDTMPGLGKHAASKIGTAFGKDNELSIEEAIASLENYKLTPPTKQSELDGWAKCGGWDQHVPRWTKEAADAATWLKQYRDKHFPIPPKE
jgi:hypothetical protein